MKVTPHSPARAISSYGAEQASAQKKKAAADLPLHSDRLTISQEGMEALGDKTALRLDGMTKEDFISMVKQWPNENHTALAVDPYHKVDPDGSIARKAYFESYLGQLIETENTIKNYYAGAYDEASSAPIGSLAYISGKYLCSWSDYFDSSLPQAERQWTHHQLQAMLTDSHVALNDPYALAAQGGPKTAAQMEEIARQAVKEKLDALIGGQEKG